MSDEIKCLHGLGCVNVELTSRCNKNCWMCGRRRMEREFPEIVQDFGDMDFSLVEKIANQLPPGIMVQLHNNGEPLLYGRLGAAIRLFRRQITHFDSNGKLLLERANEIIDNLDTLTISIIENDEEADLQFAVLEQFLRIKGNRKPNVVLRINGQVNTDRYETFGLIMAKRLLHSPFGSFDYNRRKPTIPEAGICLDFLHHLAINRKGDVSICVRFDPTRAGVLGNLAQDSLADLWYGTRRLEWLELHKRGMRNSIPLCSKCEFWGVPTAP